MQFRTPINITPCGFRIGYAQRGLLLGSCFAENIGMRMKRYKLPVVFNPFGILFNPASVARTLTRLDSGKLYERPDPKRRPVGQFRSSRFAGFGRPGRSVENDQSGGTVRRPGAARGGISDPDVGYGMGLPTPGDRRNRLQLSQTTVRRIFTAAIVGRRSGRGVRPVAGRAFERQAGNLDGQPGASSGRRPA